MTFSFPRLLALLGVMAVTTAAVPTCGTDNASPAGAAPAAAAVPTAGPGLPADFPLAPGLSACHPIVTGPEVICDWKGVDGHAVYMFYHDALPKAGYTLLPGAGEQTSPSEMGAIGFKKGSVSGAITVRGTSVTIQVLTCPTTQSCA